MFRKELFVTNTSKLTSFYVSTRVCVRARTFLCASVHGRRWGYVCGGGSVGESGACVCVLWVGVSAMGWGLLAFCVRNRTEY